MSSSRGSSRFSLPLLEYDQGGEWIYLAYPACNMSQVFVINTPIAPSSVNVHNSLLFPHGAVAVAPLRRKTKQVGKSAPNGHIRACFRGIQRFPPCSHTDGQTKVNSNFHLRLECASKFEKCPERAFSCIFEEVISPPPPFYHTCTLRPTALFSLCRSILLKKR